MRRGGRIKPVSDRRLAEREERRIEREAVLLRDRTCRLADVPGAGPCFGPLGPHHIRKASQGGAYSRDNMAALCDSHNCRLESDADLAALARSIGLVRLAGD